MGVVFAGADEHVGGRVAIKTLSDEALSLYEAQRAQLLERFRREIATTRMLQHPNIVSLLADGEEDGLPFVVLEYLEGWDLRDVLDDERKLVPERAARIGLSIALALAESHSHGVVHRDLKPENVFLVHRPGGDELVKVLDFGIARATDEEERLTVAGTALGTPRYMSPEQVTDGELTSACDIYSFGILLYEMLSGDVPYWDDNQLALALMHVNSEPPPLDVEGMEIELLEAFRALILRQMAKNPQARPTAHEVAAELARLHTLALTKAEVDPSKATQILRMDVRKVRADAGDDAPRPTRVMGVRTTMGWGTDTLEDAARAAGMDVDNRAETAMLSPDTAPPPSFNRAATAAVATGADALQKLKKKKKVDRQELPTVRGLQPVDPTMVATVRQTRLTTSQIEAATKGEAPAAKGDGEGRAGLWLAVALIIAVAAVGFYLALG